MAARSRRAAQQALRHMSTQLDEAADALRRVTAELSTCAEDGADELSTQVQEALTSASAAHMTLSALIDARRRADADTVDSTLSAAHQLVERLHTLERAAWKLAELPRKVGLMSAKLAGVLALCANLADTRVREGFNVDAAADQLDRIRADARVEDIHRRAGSWSAAVTLLEDSLAQTEQIQQALQDLPSHQLADTELRAQAEDVAAHVADVAAESIDTRDQLARDFSGTSVEQVADIIVAASQRYTSALAQLDDTARAADVAAAVDTLEDARDALLGVAQVAATIRDVHTRNESVLQAVNERLSTLCAGAAVTPSQASTLWAAFDEVAASASARPDPLLIQERLSSLTADIDRACAAAASDTGTAHTSDPGDDAEPAYSAEALDELAELADLAEHIR